MNSLQKETKNFLEKLPDDLNIEDTRNDLYFLEKRSRKGWNDPREKVQLIHEEERKDLKIVC